jgi:acetyltransferase-like isoleucine patch superfamily enzyme
MPWLLKRPLDPESNQWITRFIGELAELLDDTGTDNNEVVRSFLSRILHSCPFEELEEREPLAAFALDPRRITFEAEHYIATDRDRFSLVKPLLWLWHCIDPTPLGQSLSTGIPIRELLAKRIFGKTGRNLKIFPYVDVSVGYNINVGNDVTIHRHVLIDDVGGVEIHDGASLSDYANVYSHHHDVIASEDVTLKRTIIGKGVRVAYHATVLAGTILSDDSMLGAMALATKNLEPHVVGLGIPARPRMWKQRTGDANFATYAVDSGKYAEQLGIRANPDFQEEQDSSANSLDRIKDKGSEPGEKTEVGSVED